MITQSVAKIYLSEQRGINETDRFRTYSTFNFRHYHSEYRHPFGDLYVLNDDSLAGGHSLKMHVPENSYLILLPVVGAVGYHDSLGNEGLVNTGDLQVLFTTEDYDIELLNPYDSDLINFLQIWIRKEQKASVIKPQLANLPLDQNPNNLIRVLPALKASSNQPESQPIISMGKFAGRHEAVYKKSKTENGLFIFVIQGAFEVQGRLLHPRDGLSLSGEDNEIDMEALSNDAIIFIIELNR